MLVVDRRHRRLRRHLRQDRRVHAHPADGRARPRSCSPSWRALAWGLFYSVIQVLAYERALARWPAGPRTMPTRRSRRPSRRAHAAPDDCWSCWRSPRRGRRCSPARHRWDAGRSWRLRSRSPGWPPASSRATSSLVGAGAGRRARDLGDRSRRCSVRSTSTTPHAGARPVVLLVLIATWARAVIGAPGLRAAARRALWRVRRLPRRPRPPTSPPRLRVRPPARPAPAARSSTAARRPTEPAAGRRRADRLGGGRGRRTASTECRRRRRAAPGPRGARHDPGSHRRRGRRVPPLPAARRVARARGAEKRAAFADWDYWGRPVPGFGDPAARAGDRRPRPGGARRQPDGPHVHRRPLRRLPVRRAAPRRATPTSRPRCIATTASR